MAKNSKEQIEEDEIKVINKLQENSNENIGEIAKKCGFSRQKAWRIIKKLEEEKTIWGYRAIINNEKTNMNGFVLLIKGKRLPIEYNTPAFRLCQIKILIFLHNKLPMQQLMCIIVDTATYLIRLNIWQNTAMGPWDTAWGYYTGGGSGIMTGN